MSSNALLRSYTSCLYREIGNPSHGSIVRAFSLLFLLFCFNFIAEGVQSACFARGNIYYIYDNEFLIPSNNTGLYLI
jgi:hypothetical protein